MPIRRSLKIADALRARGLNVEVTEEDPDFEGDDSLQIGTLELHLWSNENGTIYGLPHGEVQEVNLNDIRSVVTDITNALDAVIEDATTDLPGDEPPRASERFLD